MEIPGCDPNACGRSGDESGADWVWTAYPNRAAESLFRNRARAWCRSSYALPRKKYCRQRMRFLDMVWGLNHAFPRSVDAFPLLYRCFAVTRHSVSSAERVDVL